jgi:hypothetical protein
MAVPEKVAAVGNSLRDARAIEDDGGVLGHGDLLASAAVVEGDLHTHTNTRRANTGTGKGKQKKP